MNNALSSGNLPLMKTLTVDDHKRIRIPDAKPRQVFAYEKDSSGRLTLTPVEPVKRSPAKLVRKNGKTYLVSEHPITTQDVKRALENFP